MRSRKQVRRRRTRTEVWIIRARGAMLGASKDVSHLRRSDFLLFVYPALTGWANFGRAYGAQFGRRSINLAGTSKSVVAPTLAEGARMGHPEVQNLSA